MDEVHLVWRLLADGPEPPGVMVDVGAHHGHTLLPFAQRGWRVHAFEPDASNRMELARNVGGFANVTIDPRAVSDAPGRQTLYGSGQSSGITSLAPFTTSHEPLDEVEVTTLRDYLTDVSPNGVTFLKIDVEGWELRVLNGCPWERFRPAAVVVEFEDDKTRSLGYTWLDLADFLVGKGYSVLISEWYPIVAYGGQHRWRAFKRYPSELDDARGWGNLIGVPPERASALARLARREAWAYRVREGIRQRHVSRLLR